MLSFPPALRIWLALAPADLRKGFDALAELVRQHLRDDPLSGHVFVFRNRRGDRIKLLYWDGDGFVIVYKKQESDYPHSSPCTEPGGRAHNLAVRLASAGTVDSSLPAHHSRSRPMPQPATAVVPPRRAHRPPLVPDQPWSRLTDQQAASEPLATLSSIVVRQLGVPLATSGGA